MIVAGVDEAGRGPVIGPMVMAIASIKEEDLFKLQTLGVKDSKLLTCKRRDEMLKVINDICVVAVKKISPGMIDTAVRSPSDNLNWLEARTAAELINKITSDKVILDCPSTNLASYRDYIQSRVKNKKTDVIVEHKADLNHLIVGAASIAAKIARDKEIDRISKELEIDIGSGYPSDPKTQKFVMEYWDKEKYNSSIRKSWDTWQKHDLKRKQKSLGDY